MRINEAVSKVARHRLVGDVAAVHVEAAHANSLAGVLVDRI